MALSRPCEECWHVKSVQAYPTDRPETQVMSALAYLCRSCARDLGYPAKTTPAIAAGRRAR